MRTAQIIQWIVIGALVCGVLTVGLVFGIYDLQNLKTVNHVSGNGGDLTAVAGLGMAITPDPVSHSIEFINKGVVTINGLTPTIVGGNIALTASGAGLSITSALSNVVFQNTGVTSIIGGLGISASSATGAVTLTNDGVVTINSLSPDGAGNMLVVTGGTGFTVGSAGNTLTLTNTGVISAIGGNGISVNASTGNVIITNDGVISLNSLNGDINLVELATEAAKPAFSFTTGAGQVRIQDIMTGFIARTNTDALNSHILYNIAIGIFVPVAANGGWRIGVVPGVPPNPYFPGALGHDGRGNVGGTAWQVPDYGLFEITIDCDVSPNTIPADDHLSASIAVSLGATTEDPYGLGAWIPAGGHATIDMSGGATATGPPAINRRLSLSTTFKVTPTSGLNPIAIGDQLNVHATLQHTGVGGGPYTASFTCRTRVGQVQ